MDRRRPIERIGLFGALVLGALLTTPSSAGEPDAYAVKAGFLMNFARLIEWPGTAFEEDTSPVTVAVVGPATMAENVGGSLAGRSVGRRSIVAQRAGLRVSSRLLRVADVVRGEGS